MTNMDSWLRKEFHRIEKLNDNEERLRLFEELDIVIDKRNELEDYVFKYKKAMLKENQIKRGIIFEVSEVTSFSLKSKWENNFAADLTRKEKNEIYFKDYMWHIFSYEKRDAFIGSKARQAFNRIKKTHVYVFYQRSEEVFYIDKAELLKASDFDLLDDVYIVDSEIKWTYVHTHEAQCGPYFTQKNNNMQ